MRQHLDAQTDKPHPFETIRMAGKNINQLQALLFTVLLVLGQFTVIPFITPYMINNVGLTQDQIPLIYLVGGACTVITSPLIGRLVDRFGRKKVFYVMASISIIPLLLITHLWPISIYLVLTISGVFFISISGRMIPANTLLTTVVRPQNRGGFMSLKSSVTSLASGSASLIAGSIVVQSEGGGPIENYNIVGYVAVAFTIIALLLARKLREVTLE